VAPGPELQARVNAGVFPMDVWMLWPDAPAAAPPGLPPAWVDVAAGVAWCAERARALPMAMLDPETLAWKLAGRVLLAAAGESPGHAFDAADLSTLFEQLVIQLQQFPAPPEVYRPLEDEPALSGEARVRIVTGFSGAGKTAWAAQAALHVASECAYYDVGDVPGPAIAASLVRELAAHWASPTSGGLRQVLLPGATGIQALRALDRFLSTSGSQALVVLDNAHRVPVNDLRMLIDATQQLRFVLLAQPSTSIAELEAAATIQQEVLRGWSLDQAAAEVQAQGARASVADLGRLLALTGGLPLFVRTASKLSVSLYGGDVAAMCSSVEAHTNVVATAQELILARSFDSLPEQVRDCAAVLSLSDVPLSESEAAGLIKAALGIEAAGFAAAVRHLRPLGAVRVFGALRLQIHDALRVLGLRRYGELPPPQATAGRQALKELILNSFENGREYSRFPLFIRTLVELGDLKTLIDVATEEWFHELGVSSGIWEALEAAATDEAIDAEQRFYALDGLVFAEMKSGDPSKVERQLRAMEALIETYELGRHEELVYLLKRMVFESDRGNEAATFRAMDRSSELAPDIPEHQRVLRYNVALALFKLKHYAEAESAARELVEKYFDLLGLTPLDIFGLSNQKIAEKLEPTETLNSDLKHLADSLDVVARATNAQGRDSGLARVHAAKFYGLANAVDSFIKVNQDLVDEFVGRSDYIGARQVIEEHLLPMVVGHRVLDKIVSVRSQYAVVLGYCGEYDAADAELARLDPYRPGLTPIQRAEIDNQLELVARLRRLGASVCVRAW
jgi:AAA domain